MKLDIRKNCPDCKSNAYRRIKRKWWMKFFPGIKYYHCGQCYKRFITFFDVSSVFEHRKHHRYCPGRDCSIQLMINDLKSGQLVDISRNGLCFLCPDDFGYSNKFQVRIQTPDLCESINIHAKTVSLETVPFSPESQEMKNKISAKFIAFPRGQKELLNTFIRKIRKNSSELDPVF